jgi:hypothetical protein
MRGRGGHGAAARVAAIPALVLAVAYCARDGAVTLGSGRAGDVAGRAPQAAALVAGARRRPAVATRDGFALSEARVGGRRALRADLGPTADGAIALRPPRADALRVTRVGATAARGALEDGVVVYSDAWPGIDALVARHGGAVEELLVARGPAASIAYDLALPAGWSLAEGARGLTVRDARGHAVVELRARRAWSARGDAIAVSARAQGSRASLAWDPAPDAPVILAVTWELAGQTLGVARASHTATLLTDGAVLFAGGDDGTNALASAEVYDPTTDEVRPLAASMIAARTEHSATPLRDRRVLLAGGRSGMTPVAQLEVYDAVAGAFFPVGSLAAARYAHTATLLPDGTVLLAGGLDANGKALASAEIFDPATNTVRATGALHVARARATATALPDDAGSVLVAGGSPDGSAEIYDPRSGAFTTVPATFTEARMGHAAALDVANHVVHFFGGADPAGGALRCTYEDFDYAPGTQAFALAGQLPIPVGYESATVLGDGRVLLMGGESAQVTGEGGPCGGQAFTFSLYESLVLGPSFGGGPPSVGFDDYLQDPRSRQTVTPLADGSVLLAGGFQSYPGIPSTVLDSIERRSDESDSIAYTGTMTTSRFGATSSPLLDGRVLVAGGAQRGPVGYVGPVLPSDLVYLGDIGSPLATTEVYDPSTGAYSAFAPLVAPRFGHTATTLPDGRVLVVGGAFPQGAPGAELLDVAKGTVTPVADPQAPNVASCFGHTATLLADGRVLVVGCTGQNPAAGAPEWLFDPKTATWAPTSGGLAEARTQHVAVLLRDGRVLVAGGAKNTEQPFVFAPVSTIEVFDPATSSFHTLSAHLRRPRAGAAATLLADGSVLVAGGLVQGANGGVPTATTEVLVPEANGDASFVPGADMQIARAGHTLTTLPDGRVLVVGGDPNTAPAAQIENSPASPATPEIYDPATASFAFLTVGTSPNQGNTGGSGGGAPVGSGSGGGAFGGPSQGPPALSGTALLHAATLLPTGGVLVSGGMDVPVGIDVGELVTVSLGTTAAVAPSLATGAPLAAVGGDALVLHGAGFVALDDGAGGTNALDFAPPVATWLPLNGGPLVAGGGLAGIAAWNATSAAWIAPSTSLVGPGLLLVSVGGARAAAPLVLGRAARGSTCASDAECAPVGSNARGFCANGVCCDAACDTACSACSAAAKGHGDDGTCEPVGASLADARCPAQSAATCGTTGLCDGTGACAAFADGTACGASGATCQRGACIAGAPPPRCEGNSELLGAQTIPCGAFRCLPETGACAVGPCASNVACADGFACVAGTCTSFAAVPSPEAGCTVHAAGGRASRDGRALALTIGALVTAAASRRSRRSARRSRT